MDETWIGLSYLRKKMTLKKLLPLLLLTIYCCFPIYAQSYDEWQVKYNFKVSKTTNVTYFDLVKMLFPDAKMVKVTNSESEEVVASKSIPIRELFGKRSEKLYENRKVEITQRLLTKNGKENLLWLIFSLNEINDNCGNCGINLLAAFRINKDEAETLDVAEIGDGDLIGFGNYADSPSKEQKKLELLPNHEAVVLYNVQGTALGMEEYSIVAIDEKGFRLVLGQFYLEHNTQCGGGFVEEIRFKLLKDAVNKYPKLEIIVTVYSTYDDEPESAKPEFIRKFYYPHVWKQSEQKYLEKGNFKTIDKNRKAFHRKIKEGCGTS